MKKAITLMVLTCWLVLGGGAEEKITSGDELQPGPYENTADEVIL
jgi:hypothetical protein